VPTPEFGHFIFGDNMPLIEIGWTFLDHRPLLPGHYVSGLRGLSDAPQSVCGIRLPFRWQGGDFVYGFRHSLDHVCSP
jgi:hypothetical protein